MTFPTSQVATTYLDSSSDNAGLARVALLEVTQNVNAIVDHAKTKGKAILAATNATNVFDELGGTAVGVGVFTAATEDDAQDAIGLSTVGKAVGVAATEDDAQDAIGMTTIGKQLATAVSQAAAQAVIGVSGGMTLVGTQTLSSTGNTQTGIASTATRVEVLVNGYTTTSDPSFIAALRLGTSSGLASSGYVGGKEDGTDLTTATMNVNNNSAPGVHQIILRKISGNEWVYETVSRASGVAAVRYSGRVTLGAALDRVGFVRSSGSGTFTGGTMAVYAM